MSKPKCDDPRCSCNRDDFDLKADMQAKIDEFGVAVIGVYPDDNVPESHWLVYTVGLAERGLPELVITGMESYAATTLLNVVNETLADDPDSWRQFFADGGGVRQVERAHAEDCDGVGCPDKGVSFQFVPIDPTADPPLGAAILMYGRDIKAFQLVWPDDEMRLPSDLAYNAAEYPQPMLASA